MKSWEELTDDELDVFMEENGCRTLKEAHDEYQKRRTLENAQTK